MATTVTRERVRAHEAGPAQRGWPLVVVVGLVLIAGALRLWRIETAYELFIDEVTYTAIARSFAAGNGVLLHGEPFHLHPPALFATLAVAIRLLGLGEEDLAATTFALRSVPALAGALIPALVALLVHRVTRSWTAAVPAGLLLAVEPFLIRFDSRVLLEAQAMALAAAGFLVLVVVAAWERRGQGVTRLAVVAGLLLVGSLLTKETYASVAVLPVLVLLLTGWVLQRRTTGLVLATTVAGYAVYVLVLVASGQLDRWFASKTSGLGRLLGFTQITGFNQEGSPGFLGRLLANLAHLGVTYTVIGLGVLATLWLLVLLRRGGPVPGAWRPGVQLLVLWAVCAQVHLAYAMTLGTLEEQMFYLLVVTAVPVLAIAARASLWDPAAAPPLAKRLPQRALATLVALLVGGALVLDAGTWWRLRTVPDDGYARFLAWADRELEPGTRVATTDETAQFVLEDAWVARLETGEEVRDFRAEYVLVASELLQQGYSSADADLRVLVAQGRLVFEAEGRTLGRLAVYDVSEAVR